MKKKAIETSAHTLDVLVKLPDGTVGRPSVAVLKFRRSGLFLPRVFLLDDGPRFLPAAELTAERF